jgi:hypothetical protein
MLRKTGNKPFLARWLISFFEGFSGILTWKQHRLSAYKARHINEKRRSKNLSASILKTLWALHRKTSSELESN